MLPQKKLAEDAGVAGNGPVPTALQKPSVADTASVVFVIFDQPHMILCSSSLI
jgi:hypothetical protein